MPETLTPYLSTLEAAFEAAEPELELDDDEPAVSLREYLSSAAD